MARKRTNLELNNQQQSSLLQQLKLEQLDYVVGGMNRFEELKSSLAPDADSETFSR